MDLSWISNSTHTSVGLPASVVILATRTLKFPRYWPPKLVSNAFGPFGTWKMIEVSQVSSG